MRAAAFALAVLSVGCCVRQVDPTEPKSWGREQEVWLFVGRQADLRDACQQRAMPRSILDAAAKSSITLRRNRFDPLDILIPEEILTGSAPPGGVRLPWSCVDGEFFEHGSNPRKSSATTVKVSQFKANHVNYRSLTPFKILPFRPEHKLAGTGPAQPFFTQVLNPPTADALSHRTGPIDPSTNRVGYGSQHVRFKAVFSVLKPGTTEWYQIDPDIECKFGRFKISG